MSQPFQSRISLLCFLALLLIALGLLTWMCEPFLLAVFAGQLLALASDPVHRRLTRRLNPKMAAMIVTLGLLLLIILPIFLLGLLAAHQGAKVAQDLQSHDLLSVEGVERRLSTMPELSGRIQALGRDLTQTLRTAAKAAETAALDAAKALPEILLDTGLAILSCFFLLLTGDRFIDQAASLLPLDEEVRRALSDAFKTTAALTLWASLATAATHSALVGLSFLALGIPAAVFAAAATFVLAWIPIVGSSPVWLCGGLYLLAQGERGRFIAMCALAAIGAVIDHLLRPLILRGRARIPAVLALVAIFGGLRVFGLFGVFLGPILAAELLTLLELWPIVGRRYGLVVGDVGGP